MQVQCVEEGDVLVDADGIHSAVREQLYPQEELDQIMEKYKQIAGFDVETLNNMS